MDESINDGWKAVYADPMTTVTIDEKQRLRLYSGTVIQLERNKPGMAAAIFASIQAPDQTGGAP